MKNMNHKIAVLVSGFAIALLTVVGFANHTVAAGAPTYDEVISSVDGAITTFAAANPYSEAFFAKHLAAAKKDLTDAKTFAAAGNTRGAKAKTRFAGTELRGIAQRLNSHTGRRKITEPLRTTLADLIERLKVAVTSIRRGN